MIVRCAAIALLALWTTACPAPRSRPPSERRAVTDRPKFGLTGGVPRVSLLARQFLVGREQPAEGEYAYYCYLVFADASAETAAWRRAAAIAYLELLDDVVDVERNTGVEKKQMAVLLVPLVASADADELLAKKHAEELLLSYNYDRARRWMGSLFEGGLDVGRVAIVGVATPIGDEAVAKADVSYVDLTNSDDATIRESVRGLRDRLEFGKSEALGRVVLKKLRWFFEQVGTAAESLKAIST